jgi:hypothetical protein
VRERCGLRVVEPMGLSPQWNHQQEESLISSAEVLLPSTIVKQKNDENRKR